MNSKIARKSFEIIQSRLKSNPVVALLGPRQCGKTTLAKQVAQSYPKSVYIDLENPQGLLKLADPIAFFMANREYLVVIDEIQLRPELFAPLRSYIDSVERECQILILGSASQDLIRQGSESLAGRISFLELTPLMLDELSEVSQHLLWERGGFPLSLLVDSTKQSLQWREDYLRALVERDLPQLGLVAPPGRLKQLMSMLAHNHGDLYNSQKISESLGVTGKTINSYIDYLEGAFILRRLLPYSVNLKKRLVKSPKFFYRDSGILHAIHRIADFNDLLGHPVIGNSWEGFVLEQVLAAIGDKWDAYFYRTHVGAELDLVLERGKTRIGIECKSSLSPTVSRGFWICLEDLAIAPHNAWIICPINEQYPYKNGTTIGGIRQFLAFVKSL